MFLFVSLHIQEPKPEAASHSDDTRKKCPLQKCDMTCLTAKEMIRHVKRSHAPKMGDKDFMKKIDELFM